MLSFTAYLLASLVAELPDHISCSVCLTLSLSLSLSLSLFFLLTGNISRGHQKMVLVEKYALSKNSLPCSSVHEWIMNGYNCSGKKKDSKIELQEAFNFGTTTNFW